MKNAVEVVDYPFKPGEGGIPFVDIFRKIQVGQQEGEVVGASGRKLFYRSKTNALLVGDSLVNAVGLAASYDTFDNSISFGLSTRVLPEKYPDFPEGVHPDMWAKKFIGVALLYFKRNDLEPVKLRGLWLPSSENYRQFLKGYSKGLSWVQSAQETWTGRAFASYGFSAISWLDINEGKVFLSSDPISAYFSRPIANSTP